MSEEKIKSIMHEAIAAMVKGEVEKELSFWADDATWVTPFGTFKGKEELRRYLTWVAQTVQDLTVTDSGIGIMVQEDKAVYEHVVGGTMEGKRGEVLAICVWEFTGEKIQNMRTVFDRLSIAQQAAKGWLAKRIVNSVVKRAEKGLR